MPPGPGRVDREGRPGGPVSIASRTSPSSSISWLSAPTIATRFSAQMSSQMSGRPLATRVMSRNPPAASRSSAACSIDRSSASVMRDAAVRCGTWLTTATTSSWRSGAMATTSAPSTEMTVVSWENTRSSASSSGVSTQIAPSNRFGSAPSNPSRSLPAIGWPPTKRGSVMAAQIGPFTLPTSVTMPVVSASARLHRRHSLQHRALRRT